MLQNPVTVGNSRPRPAVSPRCGKVVAAVLTPCRAPGDPDPAAMVGLGRHLAGAGCDGLFVVGSTGEMPLLDGRSRRALVAAAREGAPDATLYAGVSGMGVSQTLRYARAAADAGADVAVVMPPFFLKLNQPELLAYFTAIADACPIPVGLYHHLRMPTSIEPQTVARLARHENIVAMKDTSADAARVRAMVQAIGDRSFAVMQGREPLLLPSLQAGASGSVTALAGVVPEWHRELMEAWAMNDLEAAQQSQRQIDILAALFTLPQVSCSFAHFGYMLRRALWRRGWIECMDGMVPGFVPEPAFDDAIDAILERAALPASIDAPATPARVERTLEKHVP